MSDRFDPPEEGMLLGESIVWSRRAGTGFLIIFLGAILVMGGPLVTFLSLDANELTLATLFGCLTLLGMIVVAGSLFQTRRTRYYLTTERILKVRGKRILREVPLDHFAGRPLSQFIEIRVTHMTNNRPVHGIRIYDPVSDEVLELKGLDSNSTRAFERIGEIVECPYCGFDNRAISTQCKNCDAAL